MNKKERTERIAQLNAMEDMIKEFISADYPSGYLDSARFLITIKKNRLHRLVRQDNKPVYRTFKDYLYHFQWKPQKVSMLLFIMDVLTKTDTDQKCNGRLTTPDYEFWVAFRKVNRQYWQACVDWMVQQLSSCDAASGAEELSAEMVQRYLKEKPYAKRGYCKDRPGFNRGKVMFSCLAKMNDTDLCTLRDIAGVMEPGATFSTLVRFGRAASPFARAIGYQIALFSKQKINETHPLLLERASNDQGDTFVLGKPNDNMVVIVKESLDDATRSATFTGVVAGLFLGMALMGLLLLIFK